ncbi:SAV_915 family protein [Kitasatospora kifunensis]|uniref:SseB protein N-terminal domain-containing protein n=1 Tax=Kitasatospora kifunensis TaxID=58351 RepID=A0A7W7R6N6_KITKI|nr:SAV_915 family protein [Kitasatospora kifunensis]MBB4926361.1 hypothetical protein [Kitasatospora kifunensis]
MTTTASASQLPEAPEELPDPTVRYVPVRRVGAVQVLRLFRQRDGGRCAVLFTSLDGLHALLGAGQAATELTESAVRELTEPLGVHSLVVDPKLAAPPGVPPAPLRRPRFDATPVPERG